MNVRLLCDYKSILVMISLPPRAVYNDSMKPRLIVEQKITAFVNKYKLFAIDAGGNKGQLIGLAQQKRMAFKEKVEVYTTEEKTETAFVFRAEKVFDIHGRYFVEDTNGEMLGMFKKQFKQSLVNSTWQLLNKDGQALYEIRESSNALAIARRFGGMIPIVGDIINIITLLLKYHFVVSDLSNGEIVGKYEKTTLFRDHYCMSLTDEAVNNLDWRVYASIAVALDALQSR